MGGGCVVQGGSCPSGDEALTAWVLSLPPSEYKDFYAQRELGEAFSSAAYDRERPILR